MHAGRGRRRQRRAIIGRLAGLLFAVGAPWPRRRPTSSFSRSARSASRALDRPLGVHVGARLPGDPVATVSRSVVPPPADRRHRRGRAVDLGHRRPRRHLRVVLRARRGVHAFAFESRAHIAAHMGFVAVAFAAPSLPAGRHQPSLRALVAIPSCSPSPASSLTCVRAWRSGKALLASRRARTRSRVWQPAPRDERLDTSWSATAAPAALAVLVLTSTASKRSTTRSATPPGPPAARRRRGSLRTGAAATPSHAPAATSSACRAGDRASRRPRLAERLNSALGVARRRAGEPLSASVGVAVYPAGRPDSRAGARTRRSRPADASRRARGRRRRSRPARRLSARA